MVAVIELLRLGKFSHSQLDTNSHVGLSLPKPRYIVQHRQTFDQRDVVQLPLSLKMCCAVSSPFRNVSWGSRRWSAPPAQSTVAGLVFSRCFGQYRRPIMAQIRPRNFLRVSGRIDCAHRRTKSQKALTQRSAMHNRNHDDCRIRSKVWRPTRTCLAVGCEQVADSFIIHQATMLGRRLMSVYLAEFCAVALCGCTRNNQLMIRPVDGVLTYCSPLDHASVQGWRNARCIHELEALGFTEVENVSLAGGGGFYLADDGHILSREELTALSPDIPPQNYSFPPKGSGLKPGDAIVAINGVMTKTRSEIVPHLIGQPDQNITVRIRRKNIEQDVTMSFKPWRECDGNVFYYEKFFFHFEYADNIVPGRR